ncbi:hypothetical protein Q8A73_020392 [Channa argus]|nr:hypothetical protein Q8A73_020392 [Channa argus]
MSIVQNENVTSADLDHVLDKGDVMYKKARVRFPKSIHLAVDEPPAEPSPGPRSRTQLFVVRCFAMRHFIAKCIPFAKIIPLPKGRQAAIRGNVVCVPSEALHKLKQIHPQYEDITIRGEAELCDPTLPEENEDNGDDDVDEQIEEDYDEDDLMEIDRFESIALGDLENDIEGSQQNADKVAHNDKPEEQRNDAEQEDARLKQIKGSQRPFGGTSLIAVGDFYQLPPVGQAKPLCVHDLSQIDLWQEHFQMVTLTEIMRQKDDTAFAEMLNRIRVKGKSEDLSETDRGLLSQAITQPQLCPTDVLHIYATNKQVDAHNLETLTQLHCHIVKIDPDDYRKDPQTGRMTRQSKPYEGNRNKLHLKLLKMDDEKAGRKYCNRAPGGPDNLVYIERAEENLKKKGVVRKQFPIKLAFACTIHKVQGMTTRSAVVSLNHIFEPGMACVAVSRLTSLSGLHIVHMDETKLYANPEITSALETMRQLSLEKVKGPVTALVAAVSRPPDYSVTPFLRNLGSLLDCLEIMDCQPNIVCGDFIENLLSNARKPIPELFQSRSPHFHPNQFPNQALGDLASTYKLDIFLMDRRNISRVLFDNIYA